MQIKWMQHPRCKIPLKVLEVRHMAKRYPETLDMPWRKGFLEVAFIIAISLTKTFFRFVVLLKCSIFFLILIKFDLSRPWMIWMLYNVQMQQIILIIGEGRSKQVEEHCYTDAYIQQQLARLQAGANTRRRAMNICNKATTVHKSWWLAIIVCVPGKFSLPLFPDHWAIWKLVGFCAGQWDAMHNSKGQTGGRPSGAIPAKRSKICDQSPLKSAPFNECQHQHKHVIIDSEETAVILYQASAFTRNKSHFKITAQWQRWALPQ
jgi:hypothetical protein